MPSLDECQRDRDEFFHWLESLCNADMSREADNARNHIYEVFFSDGSVFRGTGLDCAMKKENAVALATEMHRLERGSKDAKVVAIREWDKLKLG